ncbi:MAG: Ig-like domain-containing protein [Eubacteriales bacterium]
MKKVISVFLALGLVAQIGLFSAFAAPKVAVTSIKVTPASITLAAGNTGILKATVSPATATNKAVSWKSSNAKIAAIDSTGKVKALSIGSATITCTAKDGSGKMAVSKVIVVKSTVVKPTTKAQILAAYTTVMNKAKVAKPAYLKKEFQSLPKADQHMDGWLIKLLLPLANSFMTQEQDVEIETQTKGNDMVWFPVCKASKGCLLTNVSAIKSATCSVLANGNYVITIILNEEHNPEPYKKGQIKATSNTGNMFYPLARADIDDTIVNDSTVNKVVKNVKYDLKYYNCKAILEYNPKTNQVVKLDQYMSVFIDIQDGKVLFSTATGNAILYNTMKAWNFKY